MNPQIPPPGPSTEEGAEHELKAIPTVMPKTIAIKICQCKASLNLFLFNESTNFFILKIYFLNNILII